MNVSIRKLLLFTTCLLGFSFLSFAKETQPNFVVIFIDDMGYGDIGPFGSKINETPHLDRMAKEGIKLTSFYVASAVCTPSRAALMTGSYPLRVGLPKGSGHAVLFPGDKYGLNPKEITIAEQLKKSGYATGCFGKWHLGDQKEFLPRSQGFDTYYGIPYSNDMWPGLKRWKFPKLPILDDGKVVEEVNTMEEQAALCKKFTDRATQFIRNNKDKPFFVYLPHAFVHHPRLASPQFMKNAKNVTEAQIEEVDWSVGQVLKTLRELNLDKKTLVFFTSDNGGARGCVSLPLRGGKGSTWEGGFRVPTVAWWPGTIPANARSNELITSMDLLPTFSKLAGVKVPTDRVIDGKNILSILKDEPGAKTPHQSFFYYRFEQLKAVRSGDWKLFKDKKLFHLGRDLSEKKNVYKNHPQVVKRLTALMQKFEKEIVNNSRPVGVAKNPKTLLPRPGVKGEEGYIPTLDLGRK